MKKPYLWTLTMVTDWLPSVSTYFFGGTVNTKYENPMCEH
jgi:hypothetical protein